MREREGGIYREFFSFSLVLFWVKKKLGKIICFRFSRDIKVSVLVCMDSTNQVILIHGV